jgi:hypothetical protein
VLRLHRLLNHPQQFSRQCVEVGLVVDSGDKLLQHLFSIVFAAEEAPVDGILNAAAQRQEEGNNGQSRKNNGHGRVASDRREETLQQMPK